MTLICSPTFSYTLPHGRDETSERLEEQWGLNDRFASTLIISASIRIEPQFC
jgi:hypothetical protein